MTAPTPPPRPLFALFLLIWSGVLFVLMLGAYLMLSPDPQLAPTPPTCKRWIGLESHTHHNTHTPKIQLHCLPTQSPQAQNKLKHLLQLHACQQLSPPLGTLLPRLQHGTRLRLQHTNSRCHASVLPLPAPQRILLGIRLPLNHATAQELDAIPGLSLRIAKRIVAHRKQHGPFQEIQQLQQIRGIGPKTVARLQPHLSLPPTTQPH